MHDREYRRLKNLETQAGDDADDELQRERSHCHPRQSCMYTPMNLQLRSQRQHAGGSECTLTGTAASAEEAAAAAAVYSKYARGWGGRLDVARQFRRGCAALGRLVWDFLARRPLAGGG